MIDYISAFIAPLFGLSGQHFTILIVATILFFLLWIDFGIILKNFALFSTWIAWVLAFGLCVVLAVYGIIALIVLFFTNLVGYIGAALILIGLKVGTAIIELSISKKIESDKKKEKKRKKELGEKVVQAVGEAASK